MLAFYGWNWKGARGRGRDRRRSRQYARADATFSVEEWRFVSEYGDIGGLKGNCAHGCRRGNDLVRNRGSAIGIVL